MMTIAEDEKELARLLEQSNMIFNEMNRNGYPLDLSDSLLSQRRENNQKLRSHMDKMLTHDENPQN